ncbi:S-adenosyl-L-methionine-dependent methyltransferase [Durotheca rogersii]|uniref:S-adenosyl-L-methionine-dependent methyltransferase n=1 Tax=Durotheca rogersii TaxID=419775 RepID=UPI0022203476|nr:S-adenosyl-L-methionine-dependent methyltransferase [Durotheca rogersii]KAI5857433.1 S-adenosyl-L-methionine-dependent methyltransferase [Durotheca rogersii]
MTVSALADIIRQQADILETSLPPHAYADEHGDPSLAVARSKLLEACDKLNHLVTGPIEWSGHRVHAALQYACHFRLASYVPEDGTPITYDDLAQRAGVETSQCARVLQLLMTYHIFREPGTRIVAHNRNSRVLLDEDTGMAVEWLTQDSLRSSAFFTETRAAPRKWSGSRRSSSGDGQDETSRIAPLGPTYAVDRHIASGSPRTAAEVTSTSGDRYARAMAGMAKRRQLSVEHLVHGFDWASLPNGATIVDVGGGNGHYSKAIAEVNPGLNFVVQNLNTTAEEVTKKEGVANLGGRLRFVEYDFFTPQPITHGDVYLLRRILHLHSDGDAVDILRSQLSGIRKPGARIVVMDNIAVSSGTLSTLEERQTRTLDIAMMALFNSVERDVDSWRALFKAADPKLKLVNVIKPLGSALAVMEVCIE